MTTEMMDATPIPVEVYPYEFKPLMKAIKFAIMVDRRDREGLFDNYELKVVEEFLDDFCDVALEHAV